MKETQIVCPVCGAKFAMPEHEHTAIGTVIGKDSGLGTIHPTVVGMTGKHPANRTDRRLAALAAAGIDTSNIFAMHNASGKKMLARVDGDSVTIIRDDDPKYREILRGCTIPERRLFRRWVMSQMFHMLLQDDNSLTGYTNSVNALPDEYAWKMTQEELRVQTKLHAQDYENYLLRNHWFNKSTAEGMARDYIKRLKRMVKHAPVKKYKGQEYKTVGSKHYLLNEIEEKIFKGLETLLVPINAARTPEELLQAFTAFKKLRPVKLKNTHKSAAWIDAYKGSGAFYTLQNMFLFHGCFTYDEAGNKVTNPNDCMGILLARNNAYKNEGWRMLAFLQKTIRDNGMILKDKFREWEG